MFGRTTFLGALAVIIALVASSSTASDNSSLAIQHSIRSGLVKVRGVNLGSWLVAEHWMTSDADFWSGLIENDTNSGEYTAITKAADQDTARALIQKHHTTFITEADIKAIADAGINTVRVPVGYWIVGFDSNDPSKQKTWEVYSKDTLIILDMLIRLWAVKYNVAVLVDLHAAKGSQNGNDHSSPPVPGHAYWSEYPENVQNSITAVSFLADRYKNDEAFLGMGLLNEPQGSTNKQVLYNYYQDAYKAIRATGNDCVITVAPVLTEQGPDTMVGFMEAPAYTNVWVEWHPYFLWGYENTSENDIINIAVKKEFQDKVTRWNARANHNRLFFGEWSLGTGTKFVNNKALMYEFAQAQMNVINQAEGGATFWSWKTFDDAGDFYGWSLRNALRDDTLRTIITRVEAVASAATVSNSSGQVMRSMDATVMLIFVASIGTALLSRL